jgi:hypothetical protein
MDQTFQELIELTEVFLARKMEEARQRAIVNLTPIWQTEQHEHTKAQLSTSPFSL